jgi:hypothetical protein
MRFWDGKIQKFTLLEYLGFQTKNSNKKKRFGQGWKQSPLSKG